MARRSLRQIPAVETVLNRPELSGALASLPRSLVVEAVRIEIAAERERLRNGSPTNAGADVLAGRAAVRASRTGRPALRRVINATGVVLHTNLGRAPLSPAARAGLEDVARGYASLEFDLDTGRRGHRGGGVERWLTRLTGAEAAAVVNNGAAAILLALSAVASGRRVVVSRGELVEIGGSFRVPEVMEKSGAILHEVGTTNRTHLRDYERALAKHADIGAVLRVHRSNFRVDGFTARPALSELAALARKKRVPLIEDLGSGALVDLSAFGLEPEPTVRESLAAGVALVTFSGDKLLGGSQAGMILGSRRWVSRVKRDPLARALRLDKLALAALEATLPLYADPERALREVPALAMLVAPAGTLQARAEALTRGLSRISGLTVRVVEGSAEVGGGSLPLQPLPGPVVEVKARERTAQELQRLAREASPPIVGTIRSGKLRLDPRTLLDGEVDELVAALKAALEG